MRVLITAVLIFGIATTTYALDCYTCADADTFDGEATVAGNNLCYLVPTTGSGTCTAGFYCLTKFTIVDGVTTAVQRKCEDPANDHDVTTAAMPTTNECVSVISSTGANVVTSECYLHCGTDNCNVQTSAGLTACAGDCDGGNAGGTAGSCDYLTGNCICKSTHTGTNCETAVTTTTTTRQCVQCNSETDSNCASSTTMANCPGATQLYCATTTTVVYGQAGTAVKTVTSRGCTDADGVVDECTFTNIFTDPPISDADLDYNEITCRSVCNSDGCNSNTANGVVDGNEAIRMHCVQCTDVTDTVGNGACATSTTRTICPSGTTHCKSTVSYFISNITDVHSTVDPAYSIQSITRECATAAVTAECTETTMTTVTGVKRVTCTETCTEDGCNTGWPARPKCITCSSSDTISSATLYADGFDECLENPPDATDCSTPYYEFCGIRETGRWKNYYDAQGRLTLPAKGFRHRIIRECTAFDYGGNCTTETRRGVELLNCNHTCTTDSCNEGNTGSRAVQTMIAVLIPAILGWLMQTFL